jgi:hypothetical protein
VTRASTGVTASWPRNQSSIAALELIRCGPVSVRFGLDPPASVGSFRRRC